MQTRTDDNFSDKDALFHNLSSDLVSRDALSSLPVFNDERNKRFLTYSLTEYRIWAAGELKKESGYGTSFLIYSCLFCSGAALWFSLPFTPPIYALVSTFLCLSTLIIYSQWTGKRQQVLSLVLAAALAGAFAAAMETTRRATIILDSPVTTTITGSVERREVDHRGIWRYQIAVSSTLDPQIMRAPKRVMVLARQKHDALSVGQIIEGRARLSPPSGPALVGGNDFAFGAYFNGIGATGFFYSTPKAKLPSDDLRCLDIFITCLDRSLYELRAGIAQRIRTVIGGDAGALSASMITDERRAISPDVMDALRKSGLAHIVAISGLNMALAAGIFFIGLRVVFATSQRLTEGFPTKKLSAALALIMTLAYYLISGFAVSAERAWIMMSVMLIAVILDRPAINLRNVAISGLVIAIISPSEIMGASFQMSFAATIALVAIYGAWGRRSPPDLKVTTRSPGLTWKILRSLFYIALGTMVTSVIGGVATAPFSITYFHQIAPYGFVANLMAMPLMALVVMPSALVAMLVMPFGLDAIPLKLMGLGIQWVIDIAVYVANWGDEYGIGRLPQWFLPACVTLLLIAAVLRSKLAYIAALPTVPLFVAAAALPTPQPEMIVYESGDLILLNGAERFSTNKQRPSDFMLSQWSRALSLPDQHQGPLIDPKANSPDADVELSGDEIKNFLKDNKIETGRFYCQRRRFCIADHQIFGRVIQVLDLKLLGPACDIGDIVVTPIQSRMQSCRSGAKLLTARMLRQTGTVEFYVDHSKNRGYVIQSALNGERRPWSMHRYYDWRSDSYAANTDISDSAE